MHFAPLCERAPGHHVWLVLACMLAMLSEPVSALPAGESEVEDSAYAYAPLDAAGRALHIVRFHEAALASYAGNIEGLAPTSRRATGRKIDLQSAESRAYLDFLSARQTQHLQGINSLLGRSASAEFQYLNVLNGMALRLSPAEADQIARLPFVAHVERDVLHQLETDIGPDLIGAPAFWDGETTSGLANRGEGLVIGIIDSGFHHAHPSFAATAEDGYSHTNPVPGGLYLGVCNPAHPNHQALCNDKLIGSYSFNSATLDPEDISGHGTHVASTAAGNPVTASIDGLSIPMTGVAPRANLINYLVCRPGCPTSSSVAAVNQAIPDGVDILNYSISGSDNPWANSIDLAFLDAYNAGIYVSTSAGNTGPGAGTVAKTGPWNATVANTTHRRVIGYRVNSAGITDMVAAVSSGPAFATDLSANLADVADEFPGNALGCNAYPAGSLSARIALVQRGGCTFAVKVNGAQAAGAVAVLVFNSAGGPPTAMGALEDTVIPSAMLDSADGPALQDALAGGASAATTVFSARFVQLRADWEDVVAAGSSRGPSVFDVLKPDFGAPGTNILAADIASVGSYSQKSGTSMAAPHGAGAAALLMHEHPDWSPAEIKSAIALTANREVLRENGVDLAGPFDIGSGRIDLRRAARIGFVMDETHAAYVAANPALGGRPATLNQPSLQTWDCPGICNFTRRLRSVLSVAQTYQLSVAVSGIQIQVSPTVFTLQPGQVQTIQINADVAGLPLNNWAGATIEIQPVSQSGVPDGAIGSDEVPEVRMPVVLRATADERIYLNGFELL